MTLCKVEATVTIGGRPFWTKTWPIYDVMKNGATRSLAMRKFNQACRIYARRDEIVRLDWRSQPHDGNQMPSSGDVSWLNGTERRRTGIFER